MGLWRTVGSNRGRKGCSAMLTCFFLLFFSSVGSLSPTGFGAESPGIETTFSSSSNPSGRLRELAGIWEDRRPREGFPIRLGPFLLTGFLDAMDSPLIQKTARRSHVGRPASCPTSHPLFGWEGFPLLK